MGSQRTLSVTRPGSMLRVNTNIGSALSTSHLSVDTNVQDSMSVLSPNRRYESPISRVRCDGWCGYDLKPCATVVSVDSPASSGLITLRWAPTNQVSLSACADLQRAWEGPRGSLTVVLCEFLSKPDFHRIFPFLWYGERTETDRDY